jgi:hypothetical protein
MKKLLHFTVVVVGILLTLFSGYQANETFIFSYWIISGTSLLMTTCAMVLSGKNIKFLHWVSILLAITLIVLSWFVVELCLLTFIIGLFSLIVLISSIRLLPTVENFILHAQDGSILMEIKKVEFKKDNLIVRGKMMGTMPTVAEMRPEEIWKAFSLIPLGVLLGFPAYLFKAWKTKGISKKQTNAPKFGY